IDQRAVNTPATIHSDIAKGESPELTSFVGASAAPSQTPAASPHSTPMPCTDRIGLCAFAVVPIRIRSVLSANKVALNKEAALAAISSVQRDEQRKTDTEH